MVFPSSGTYYIPGFKNNLGSAYIIAYLRKYGFNAEQFITNESYNVKECVKRIMNFNPKIIGFTVYDNNFMQCVLISNGLKAFNSEIIIVFGGPTPSVQAQEILETIISVDICVRWEGEETLLELISNLSINNYKIIQVDLEKITGITFRNKNNIISTPDRNVLLSNRNVKDYLDKYPSPYLSDVIPTSEAFPIGIITARGCNQNCIYCNCAVISKRNIFFHSIRRVIEELSYLNEFEKFHTAVPINDDGFTTVPSRARRICEQIIENDIKVPLSCSARCDMVNEELLDLMKEAGFVSIGFSLESAVPRVLRAIGKVNPPNSCKKFNREIGFIENLKSMTSYARKIGINHLYVSVMVGLPGESYQEAQKTIEMIRKLDIDYYIQNNLQICKGTPLYQNHKTLGYKIKPAGRKNKIMTTNSYPFDVHKVRRAPKSLMEKNRRYIDYCTIKIISFIPKRQIQKPFFDNIIINSDILKNSTMRWIQNHLAIGGIITHIYSNKKNCSRHQLKNFSTLYNEFSPTTYYECYFWEKLNGQFLLKSVITSSLGENLGYLLNIENAKPCLEKYRRGIGGMENVICAERSKADTQATIKLLNEISKSKDSFNYILNKKPLPHFQNLCRWTIGQANCHKLETVIIDDDDYIRICWNSEPVGKISNSFSDIVRNLQNLHENNIEKRNCYNCNTSHTCVKCFFPYPLSPQEYCECKRRFDTSKPARLINTLNILKDLLYKPINLIEL
jgi:radical SAM superfamily enzyme YgiQ (UPF0313 family)